MPATQETSPPSTPVSTSNILLFTGLILLVLVASICVAIRKRQTQRNAVVLPYDPLQPSTAPKRPLHYDVHLAGAGAVGAPTWCSIQPLAVQTPFRQQTQKPRPTLKRSGIQSSLSSRSEASIDTADATLLDEFPVENFYRHLHIAVLIAMPLPPGPDAGDALLSRDVADGNMTIGVADTVLPTS